MARENGISIAIDVPLPEQLYITETNLCIVFANLLKNALESCMKSEKKHCFIHLQTMLIRSQIVIFMENTIGVRPVPYIDGFMSTEKGGRKGIGLSSIQNIAEQYGGDARFEIINDTTFSSQVPFINQEDSR